MSIKYPLFGKADDKTVFIIDSEAKLGYHMENIDVENKEYTGWDCDGKPVEFYIDNKKIKARGLSDEAKLEDLKQAIFDYVRAYRPAMPFDYKGPNVVELFIAAEEHIKQGKSSCQILTKIKEFFKK